MLKCGFHKKSFILNATLVSCPFPSLIWVGATANPPKSEDGNGQLTRVAFKKMTSYEIHTLIAQKLLWKCWCWFFPLLVCFSSENILCMFTNYSKKSWNVGGSFFSFLGLFRKVLFLSHTMLFSVSVTLPFFVCSQIFCENTTR